MAKVYLTTKNKDHNVWAEKLIEEYTIQKEYLASLEMKHGKLGGDARRTLQHTNQSLQELNANKVKKEASSEIEKETTSQVNINKRHNLIDRARKIPRYVATTLPPLNFNQIGKT